MIILKLLTGFFSLTALSLISFQSIEIVQAVMDTLFHYRK